MHYIPFQVFYLAHPFAGDVPAIFNEDGLLLFGFHKVCENLKLGDPTQVARSLSPDGLMMLTVELPFCAKSLSETITKPIDMEFIDIANLHHCIHTGKNQSKQIYDCYVDTLN